MPDYYNFRKRDPRIPNRHASPNAISVTPYYPGSKYLRVRVGNNTSAQAILNTEGAFKLLAQLALMLYQVHTPEKLSADSQG